MESERNMLLSFIIQQIIKLMLKTNEAIKTLRALIFFKEITKFQVQFLKRLMSEDIC